VIKENEYIQEIYLGCQLMMPKVKSGELQMNREAQTGGSRECVSWFVAKV